MPGLQERERGMLLKRLKEELTYFLSKKCTVLPLLLTAVCSYGFEVVTPIIGIDDTAVSLYYEDGLAVVMGRWVFFLLNRVFHLSEYSPFITEMLGVLFMCLAAVLFSVLFRRIFEERVPLLGYTVFMCVFVSSPVISELYIYYLHNGVGIGYCVTALALLLFMDALKESGVSRFRFLGGSMLLLWIAAGLYESFMIVYILGVVCILFLRGAADKEEPNLKNVFGSLGMTAVNCVVCLILREIMIASITFCFHLQDMIGIMDKKSIGGVLVLFQDKEGIQNLIMLLKRFWVMYHVNAIVHLPVTVYEFAILCFAVGSVVLAVRRKNIWYPVLFAGMYITPALLTVIEAKPTLYRSCQFLPFYAATGVLVFCFFAGRFLRKGAGAACGLVAASALIFNQASELNRNFYVDYLKYQDARNVTRQLGYEIEKRFGEDIPVIFTGHYILPDSILGEYRVDYSSKQYQLIAMVTDLVDVNLKDKFCTPVGYNYIGEAINPFLLWAVDAFDGTGTQMIRFMQLEGYSFETVTDPEIIKEAREIGESMPKWPQEGSVSLQDGYVLVNF